MSDFMTDFGCVLAFGDSHVAGCELIDLDSLRYRSLIQADALTKPLAFPALLGQRLNLPVHNFAMTAGSNPRSLRKLCTELPCHHRPLVLFAYTSIDRSEFTDPNIPCTDLRYINQDEDGYFQTGPALLSFRPSNVHPLTSDYLKHNTPISLDQLIFYVESACARFNATCIHIPLFKESIEQRPQHLMDFDGHGNYWDWCQSRAFQQTKYHHFNIDAHRALTDVLYQLCERISTQHHGHH